jgi:hypothetical protein
MSGTGAIGGALFFRDRLLGVGHRGIISALRCSTARRAILRLGESSGGKESGDVAGESVNGGRILGEGDGMADWRPIRGFDLAGNRPFIDWP